MPTFDLPSPLWELIAERFKALGEPVRLEILYALQQGERTVSELTEVTGLGQANASKHLQILHAHGFVGRRKAGLYVYYSLVDTDAIRLCDLMCGRIGEDGRPRGVPQE